MESIRNILAHRLTGRRNVRGYGIVTSDRSAIHMKEEVWNVPGSDAELIFDDQLIETHLEGIASLLTSLTDASVEFVKANRPAKPVK
jgi:hypothetical protein